jgi:hypothetical protein
VEPRFFALVFMVAIWPLAAREAWKGWKGERGGQSRETPLAIFAGGPFFGIGLAMVLTHGTVRTVLACVWIVVMLALLALLPALSFWGRPRFLVPPHLRSPSEGAELPPYQSEKVPVQPDDAAVRSSYRDPWALAVRLFALVIFLALEAGMFLVGIEYVAAGLVAFTLFLWARVLRAGVSADATGITLRTERGTRTRVRWEDIDRFELESETGLPHVYAVLQDGEEIELEPLGGVEMEPKRRRWEWAERSVAGLSAQLRNWPRPRSSEPSHPLSATGSYRRPTDPSASAR